jgi:hypothetical protein
MTDPRTPPGGRPLSSTSMSGIPLPLGSGESVAGGYRSPDPGSGAAAGWVPPKGPPSGLPTPPAGPPGSTRRWIIAVAAVVVVLAVAVTLVFTLGGSHTVVGKATPATDARTVAQTFLHLQTQRYNAGSTTSTPPPAAAAYAGVSCAQDLSQMRGNGANPPPLSPPHKLFYLAILSISPASNGHQLMRISRYTVATGDVADDLFTLQREAGKWTVCGLFPDTQPPDPAGSSDAGGSDGSGQPAPTTASSATDDGAPSTHTDATGPQGFVDGFAQAINSGQTGTAAEAICLGDPGSESVAEDWISAHDHVAVQSLDTASSAGGGITARLQVTAAGQAPASYTALIQQASSGPCLAQIQPS